MNKWTFRLLDVCIILWGFGTFVSAVMWVTSLVLSVVDMGYHTVRSSEQYFIFMVVSYFIMSGFAYFRGTTK
jgi:hypothetical protein